MFPGEELANFAPDIVFIHTTNRNITAFPSVTDKPENVQAMLGCEFDRFKQMWTAVGERFKCPIIQNNFEMPFYRLMGNRDCSDYRGRENFISRLNMMFYEYSRNTGNFYINDINYISASYGLKEWSNPLYWNMYKYALCFEAIPEFAFNTANIIKSVFGKNKKAIALDLDNTLWGGVVGDDGVEHIQIGQETGVAQSYYEFQNYIKAHKDLGIMLTVCSKNDEENAIAGLNHPEGVLKLKGVCAPVMDGVENYIQTLDRSGYFEVTTFSEDDIKRNEMYKANIQRAAQQATFENYTDYLLSLDMNAVIDDFIPMYIQRITQLSNKSNQFNVTTKRYTTAEMEAVFASDEYIRLYGKLTDKFGDNGVVSVVIGKKDGKTLNMELWLMSCRVLKRDMELAMLDTLVEKCRQQGIDTIKGYYYPTAKNGMVKELYKSFGFDKISEDEDGNTVWTMSVADYEKKNHVINVHGNESEQ